MGREFKRKIELETIGDLKNRLKKLKSKVPALEEASMRKITMKQWISYNDRIDKNMRRQRKIRKKIREKRIK
ncbi:hypothetical protein LCGC14_1131060 [marine sediment metagenome]|uniref:Uncharacterized protein n=1 Tax=marine sediment metagenome TaxID=412755 RepID=A0A0F9Q6V9_9ZZZZ